MRPCLKNHTLCKSLQLLYSASHLPAARVGVPCLCTTPRSLLRVCSVSPLFPLKHQGTNPFPMCGKFSDSPRADLKTVPAPVRGKVRDSIIDTAIYTYPLPLKLWPENKGFGVWEAWGLR